MTDKVPASDQRQALEADYTFQRVVELRVDPVKGSFDAAHLREINRRIFQDLPGLGFDQVTPGEYRPQVPPGNDWIKTRRLETLDVRPSVAYSAMDNEARSRLEEVLKRADPVALSKLSPQEFTSSIGRLYTALDYIHPFPDGNSRTLREFTRQLAEESGYSIEWDRFNQTPAGRDILYIARDISVNRLALPHVIHEDTKRSVVFTMDQFDGNRDLPDLLRDAVKVPSLEDRQVLRSTVASPAEPSSEGQFAGQNSTGYQVKVVGDIAQPESKENVLQARSEPEVDL